LALADRLRRGVRVVLTTGPWPLQPGLELTFCFIEGPIGDH